jgi:hypothetical protein
MAQKILVTLVDDIDGSEAAETVRFGLDGTHYEMDLSSANAAALRSTLAPYAQAGRKVSGTARTSARNGGKVPAAGLDNAEIRSWAKAEGLEVNERGRIPAAIVARYRKATGKPASSRTS